MNLARRHALVPSRLENGDDDDEQDANIMFERGGVRSEAK